MHIIKHRQNKFLNLKNKDIISGVEIDIRIFNNEVVLQHDPFYDGVEFNEWINVYDLEFLIINVKEEGLEDYIQKILKNKDIKNYFIFTYSHVFKLVL